MTLPGISWVLEEEIIFVTMLMLVPSHIHTIVTLYCRYGHYRSALITTDKHRFSANRCILIYSVHMSLCEQCKHLRAITCDQMCFPSNPMKWPLVVWIKRAASVIWPKYWSQDVADHRLGDYLWQMFGTWQFLWPSVDGSKSWDLEEFWLSNYTGTEFRRIKTWWDLLI